jgi:hypothetical protein
MYKVACLSLFATALTVAPALAQNRFMDEAREKAARRAENAAIRAAEHPETTRTATKEPDTQKPAETQAAPSPSETQGAAPAQQQPATAPAQ